MEELEKELNIITNLVQQAHGPVKTGEITAAGVEYHKIIELFKAGSIIRAKSGYYTVASAEFSEEELIASMFPDGILTMETALYYQGYLSKRPLEWRIAISKNTSKSRFKLDYPILTPYYTEPDALDFGVMEITIQDHQMKIYDKDRLICEVLKYQEKMDREDFKTAVKAYIMDDGKDVANLMDFARQRKVLKKAQDIIGIWL